MNQTKGYITLLSVLLIGAVGTVIAVSIVLLGLSSSRTSFAFQQSKQARALSDMCSEEALMRMKEVTSYSGTATMTVGAESCTYTVTNTGGQNRTITAQAMVGTITRKVSISIDRVSPSIDIISWQEVP